MRPDEIFAALPEIDEKLINDTEATRNKKSRKPLFLKIVAVAACVCLVLTAIIFIPNEKTPEFSGTGHAFAIEAVYPEMPQYPDSSVHDQDMASYYTQDSQWRNYIDTVTQNPDANNSGLENFFGKLTKEFLGDIDDNAVYSPFSLYIAFSMLAETTSGDSREQILDLLGAETIEAVRKKTNALWLANYRDDGITKSLFANSIWLNENIAFKMDALDILKNNYYASSFCGDVTSNEFFDTCKSWISKQTGGLLDNQIENIKRFNADTIFMLVNTVYFEAVWKNSFGTQLNKTDVFYSPSMQIQCEYMCEKRIFEYYWGEKFSAVSKPLEKYGNMLFILPDEGIAVNELITDNQVMRLLTDCDGYENNVGARVNLSVPKFDISADYDIIDSMKKLGMTDIFDPYVSDFSAITDENELTVSDARHAARVLIDEEGCLGAAFTTIATQKSSIAPFPEKEIDFTLDRPFVFAVLSDVGTPLFIGVVNNPLN